MAPQNASLLPGQTRWSRDCLKEIFRSSESQVKGIARKLPLGVRLQDEPDEAHRFTITAGSPADGSAIAGLAELPSDAWISFVVRDGRLISAKGTMTLRAGDEVVVLTEADVADELPMLFEGPGKSDRGWPDDQPAN